MAEKDLTAAPPRPSAREDYEPPSLERFAVRSDLTGAVVVGPLDSRAEADEEAERLNREAKRDGLKQAGRAMSYSAGPMFVLDREADVAEHAGWIRDALEVVTDPAAIKALKESERAWREQLEKGGDE